MNTPPAKPVSNSPEQSTLVTIALFVGALSLCFWKPLADFIRFAWKSDIHSYVLLVPFMSFYMAGRQMLNAPSGRKRASAGFWIGMVGGLLGLGTFWGLRAAGVKLNRNDALTLTIFSYVCFLLATMWWVLGSDRAKSIRFPLLFLLLTVPLPTAAVHGIEVFFQYASAEAASLLFNVSGTPVLRDGLAFRLPGIALRVAEECSGIRSSLVLFITCLLGGYLFLERTWTRTALAVLVIPLAVFRNAVRIVTLGLLCVHIDPSMMDSAIHSRGGPIFFTGSLVPLFIALFLFRRWERRNRATGAASPPPPTGAIPDKI